MVLPVEKFPSFALSRNTEMIANFRPIICQVVAYGRLTTTKLQTSSSKSGRGRFSSLTRGGRLQEAPNIVIWLQTFLENWSLRRGVRNQRLPQQMFDSIDEIQLNTEIEISSSISSTTNPVPSENM